MTGIVQAILGMSFGAAPVAAQVIRRKIGTSSTFAVTSTAQSKFGGSSQLYALLTAYTNVLDYSTSDLTIEFWIRYPTISRTSIPVSTRTLNNTLLSGEWQFVQRSDNKSQFNFRNLALETTVTVSANTWYHFAIVRSGSSFKMYQDGVEVASGTESGAMTNQNIFLQNTGDGAFGQSTDGYIDEFRLSKTARYTAAFTPSTTPFVNDDNTLLLLHMNGTDNTKFFEDDNGVRAPLGLIAQNQTQISTAQSKFGGSSLVFDGNNDWISIPSMPGITGDYTIECWARFDILPWNQTLDGGSYMMLATGSATDYIIVYRSGTGSQVQVQVAIAGKYGSFTKSGVNLAINTWYHIAVVRNNGVFKVFFDGVDLTTFTNDSGFTNSGRTENIQYTTIGKFIDARGSWDGYMDEIRISNTARYTADFTPPTTPFVNDANTVLLVHADGTNASTVFRDDNGIIGSTPKVLSPQGNTQISTAQAKFGSSSAYFDGTGDYLRLGQPGNFNFGSDNWTIEGFIRPTNNLSGYKVVYNHNDNGTDRSWITIQLENSTLKSWGTASTSSWSIYSDLSFGSLSVDTWYHFALVRDGSTMRAFLNGTQINTASCTGWVIPAQTAAATLSAVPASYFYGWMDGIRISNTARYGASGYTTPTAAFTQDSNTLMLLNFEGANASTTFIDSAGRTQKGVSAIGNAQVSTAQSKFGGSSSLYDGNGDYLQLANSNDFNFGSGNWTAEFWWYQPSNVAAGIYPTIICFGANGSDTGFLISSEPTTNKVNLISSADGSSGMNVQASSGNISAATWNHIAVVVNSSVATIYVNGTASGVGYSTKPKASTGQMYIGGGLGGLSSGTLSSTSATVVNLNGYLDEIRISNTARYTANFTAPTAPFQNDDNTVLLLHMDGTNASTAFFDDNGAKPYTP